MLRSAAVGAHGRGSSVRLLTCGLMLVLAALSSSADAQAPSPSVLDDLLPELAAKVTSALPAGAEVNVTVDGGADGGDARTLRARIATFLAARGFRIGDGTTGIASVAIGCGRNLREHVCVAQIHSDGRDQIATVTRRLTASASMVTNVSLALELRPLVSQQMQILDVAVFDERLVVLDVAAITVVERKDDTWRRVRSRPLPVSPAWPRDARARIRVDGDRVDLFLPSLTCRGRTDSLELTCSEGQQAWPIGVENRGLERGRNYFKTLEGAMFYNAAPLGAAVNDDAIALTASCAPGMYVAAVSPTGRDTGDLLQLSRVADGRLVHAASPLHLPGVLTALWAQPNQASAVVVTHDIPAGRYDAFQTTISCSR